MKLIRALAAIALFFASASSSAFLVSDTTGNRLDVSGLLGDGKWLVVMLWQIECPLCEEQKPTLVEFHNKHANSKAHVIGLAIDGHEYMPQIMQFMKNKPTPFPNYVVFGDVFKDQILDETGKHFYTAPGYLVYSPNGELVHAINSRIDIEELVAYIEHQMN